jgi:hypothetical protein
MKKILAAFMVLVMAAFLSGCARDTRINGTTYEAFGLANQEAKRDPNVIYELSAGSVIVGILLCETIIVPIYIVGWDLYEPVKMRDGTPLK